MEESLLMAIIRLFERIYFIINNSIERFLNLLTDFRIYSYFLISHFPRIFYPKFERTFQDCKNMQREGKSFEEVFRL